MTWLRTLGEDGLAGGAQYDPHKLSSPQVFLLSMLIFLAIAGFVAAILYRQISTAFATNPGLNGLILGVLAVGILLAFNQVIRLFREVRWIQTELGSCLIARLSCPNHSGGQLKPTGWVLNFGTINCSITLCSSQGDVLWKPAKAGLAPRVNLVEL